ncbi:(d)CMP kinase [Lachnoclostridium sp. Marseille-P6806]|uniref:(d)CMP kinase n=1 Tax=Lachnoclostridium sp. Marseille-P6806 TaxID=2364793 RepID=UPI001031ABE3|nr:(d)CMP kinase [Lachnoclostridium sp. Marseille-P6806]
MAFSIAIDGPAGAGKSTIARRVARQLGFIYVDTGAMYRAMAVFLLRRGISPENAEAIGKACGEADISICYQDGEQIVLLNGENVNPLLRTEQAGNMASASSVNPSVREKLVELQQKLAAKTDVVMDGRDIGTVVLRGADCKIYMTASVEVRAARRAAELLAKGEPADTAAIGRDIAARDHRDMTRETSPLRQAEDAVYLDTSDMTIEEVSDRIIAVFREKTGASQKG